MDVLEVPDLSLLSEVYIVYRRSLNDHQHCDPGSASFGEKHLVEEHILPISALPCKVFQISILAYPMFLTELLPELTTDYIGSCQ